MLRPFTVARLAALVLAFCAAMPATAQVRASERGSVSQTVDGTVITVDYGRAQVRGRENIFGKVVTNGEMWTPGANWATTLEVSKPVRLQGRDLPAGKYSMWILIGPDQWTVNLHRNPQLFHTRPPKASDMLLSIPVKPTQGEPTEVLTFDFPRVAPDSTTLRFRWATTVVLLDIVTRPTQPTTSMTEQQMAPFLGSYLVTMIGERGPSPEMRLEIVNAKGALRGIIDSGAEPMQMEFIPTSDPNRFMPAFLDKGKVFDVEVLPITFDVEAGRATGFHAPGAGTDQLWLRARRKE